MASRLLQSVSFWVGLVLCLVALANYLSMFFFYGIQGLFGLNLFYLAFIIPPGVGLLILRRRNTPWLIHFLIWFIYIIIAPVIINSTSDILGGPTLVPMLPDSFGLMVLGISFFILLLYLIKSLLVGPDDNKKSSTTDY